MLCAGAVTTPQEFNQSVRELLEVVRTADLTKVAALTDLRASIDAAKAAISPAVVPGVRMQAGLALTDFSVSKGDPDVVFDNPNEFFKYSPVIGELNPISPMAQLNVVDGQVYGQVTLGATHNGPPGSVHGGMIALVLDELLGCACLADGRGGFTGTLSIRYQGLVPLDTEVELHGWVDRIEGRKIFAKGEIRLGDEVLTVAEGIFIQAKEAI